MTETGRGPTVVLLSSMLICGSPYQPTIAALSERFRVLLVELPGSGRGSRLRSPWTLEQYASWLEHMVERLETERVTLIGHSMSAAVALIVGARRPPRVSRLVLVAAVAVNPPGSPLRLVGARAADLSLEPRFTLLAAPALAYNLVVHPRNALSLLRRAATEDLSGHAARVRVPTLLAWGARDHTVPVRSALAIHHLIPGSTLFISPEGSHDWLVERPSEFADAVADFVASR